MIKLGIIFGGMSTEHEVSVASATSIIQNLDKEKYEIYPIYIDQTGIWNEYNKPINEIKSLAVGDKLTEIKPVSNVIEYLKNMDLIFPVLHGLYGEDGTIQGMLELLKIPYVGSRVLGSSISMDKIYTKIILKEAGIPQANSIYIKAVRNKNQTVFQYINKQFEEQNVSIAQIVEIIQSTIHFPLFVKPSNSGSSVGVHKVTNEAELKEALIDAGMYDTKILLEEEIIGRELECAVLGNKEVKAACVGEVLSTEEFYTFEAKYQNVESRILIPAKIPKEKLKEIQNLAIKAFKAVDAKGLARVDFFIRQSDGRIYINEINTMPGFTQTSMYPKLWEESGLSYTELLDELIKLAYS